MTIFLEMYGKQCFCKCLAHIDVAENHKLAMDLILSNFGYATIGILLLPTKVSDGYALEPSYVILGQWVIANYVGVGV